jgi:hypothetical protein
MFIHVFIVQETLLGDELLVTPSQEQVPRARTSNPTVGVRNPSNQKLEPLYLQAISMWCAIKLCVTYKKKIELKSIKNYHAFSKCNHSEQSGLRSEALELSQAHFEFLIN